MVTDAVGRGRPRRPETDRRIVDAAVDLLRESGPTAVSIEAVATRSGVARSTIYRRYRNHRELIGAALDELIRGPFPAPDLPLEQKLRWILVQVSELLDHGIGRGGASAVLTNSDPDFTAALRARLADRLGSLRALMEDDLASGALARWVDPEALVSLLFGAYLGEVVRHDQVRDGWFDAVSRLLAEVAGPVQRKPDA